MQKKIYIKKFPKDIERILYGPRVIDNYTLFSSTSSVLSKFIFQIMPPVLIMVGMTLITIVIYPIFSYQVGSLPKTFRKELIKPIKLFENYQIYLQDEEEKQKEKVLSSVAKVDTTDPNVWFPSAKYKKVERKKVVNYTISIPKIGIKEANVEIGGMDLKKSLIHYPNSSFPGELGNPVIFGHSTIPIFFNPKIYETIFSTLPELKKGDSIIARIDGVEYFYEVYKMVTVDPDDLTVLEQKYDRYDLSLITCVPPGTLWKRLVVQARLKEI